MIKTITIIGDYPDVKKVAWLLERHGEFNLKPRNMVQQKIEEYLNGRSIQYVFKNPVYIAKKNKFFFVDYFVPGYNVLIDIRPVLSSEYFDAMKEKERRQCMKSLKSKYRYQVIDFDDIIKKRYITKLDRQFDSVYNIYKL